MEDDLVHIVITNIRWGDLRLVLPIWATLHSQYSWHKVFILTKDIGMRGDYIAWRVLWPHYFYCVFATKRRIKHRFCSLCIQYVHWDTTERGGALYSFTLRIHGLRSIIHFGRTFWYGEFSRSVALSVPNWALIFRRRRVNPYWSLVCSLLQLASFHLILRLPIPLYDWDEFAADDVASECIQYPAHNQHEHLHNNGRSDTALNKLLGIKAIYEQKCNLY
jgi:hypothetical protein